MNKLVAQGAADHRQIIYAERSPRTVILFVAFLIGTVAALIFFDGTDPVASPARWFYSVLGMVCCGAGALAAGWLSLRPQTNRIELDRDGLVLRSLFRTRRYLWRQLGPFGPVEQSMRARLFPAMASWYAGAFETRTLSKLGEIRAPEDNELHAADVNLNPFLLERGPKLKTTRRFCDILNEWRSASLAEEELAGDNVVEFRPRPRPNLVRWRVYVWRLRFILLVCLGIALIVAGPQIVDFLLVG